MNKKVVVVWGPNGVGTVDNKETASSSLFAEIPPQNELRKECRVDKSIKWSPASNRDRYVHQILWQDSKTSYVGKGEILSEYLERARKEIAELISNFLSTLDTDERVETEVIWEGYPLKIMITPFKRRDNIWVALVSLPPQLKNSGIPAEIELPKGIAEAIDRQKERKEKIEEAIRALPAPQDFIVIDGEKVEISWEKHPQDENICALFVFSAAGGIQGHILSLYSDCRDYKMGTASARAFQWIEAEGLYLLGGKKPSETFVAKLGAAEFKADQARLTESNKTILNAGNAGLQRSLEEEKIPLSSFTAFEQSACHFAKLVCRRGVVELALEHYKTEGKVRKVEEYRNYAKGIADKVLEFLLSKTDKIPSFPFRFFPKSVKGGKKKDLINDYNWRYWKVVEHHGEPNEYINVRPATKQEILDVLGGWTDWEHGSGFYGSDEKDEDVFYLIYPEGKSGKLLENFDELAIKECLRSR